MEDNTPDASELLDFELIAKSQPENSRGLWLWVVLIVVLAGGGGAGWMYLQSQTEDLDKANAGGVPLIMAPQFSLKDKPSDPGGMKIPDRDKSVYNRMTGNAQVPVNRGVEHILPPAEKPLRPQRVAPKLIPVPPVPLVVKPVPTAPKFVEQPRVIEPVKAVAPPPAPVVAKVVPTPPPTPSTLGKVTSTAPAGLGYMIQLSAVRTEKAANGEWKRLSGKHPDILGALQTVIQRADLGSKGIFYRVRGGWLSTRAQAKSVCAELKRRNVGCIIVKP